MARFLFFPGAERAPPMTTPAQIQSDIESRLASSEPDVEVLACELNGGTVRLYIDHPSGVDLGLCERVTRELRALRETYALEVSSPGPKRPLTKPEHYRRFIGRRAKIRTLSDHDGRRAFTGELVAADDAGVTIGTDGALVSIPYDDIGKANLAPESAPVASAKPSSARKGTQRNRAQAKKRGKSAPGQTTENSKTE